MDDKDWTWIETNVIHSDAPDEYKQEALKWTERKVGEKLFDILWKSRLPAVVDIDEQIETIQDEYMRVPNDVIRIKVRVSPVHWHNITLPYFDEEYGRPFYKREDIFARLTSKINKKWRKACSAVKKTVT